MSTHKKNIACIESLWDSNIERRMAVTPLLEFTSNLWSVKFSYLTCNTVSELKYNLNLLCKRSYGILYMAFHGSSGVIELHDGSCINLTELSEMMGKKFANWVIHFSSCSMMKVNPEELKEFVAETKVASVIGYTKTVGWAESAAMEMLLFEGLQSYKSLPAMWRNLQKNYPDLVEKTGLMVFLD